MTAAEKERIERQGWNAAAGIPAGQPLFVWHSGPPWNKRYRLAHQPNGACVFLNEKGLCRIHAQFGEEAKPLACCIYPYAFHPTGRGTAVSLRFSCPSVIANRGKPVREQASDIRKLARAVVPKSVREIPPPKLSARSAVDWNGIRLFRQTLDSSLADESIPLVIRLRRILTWLRLVDEARLTGFSHEQLSEFLEIIVPTADMVWPADSQDDSEGNPVQPLSAPARWMFRLLAGQYARKDTEASRPKGLADRFRLLQAAIRISRGKGTLPPLRDELAAVPFERLEQPFGRPSIEMQEILTRYLRVKVQGMHFCGRGYYDVPLVEGFESLTLVYPVTFWLARWYAASHDRDSLQTDDIAWALASVDHQHGYSPLFGSYNFRRRVRVLAARDELGQLIHWYSR